MLDTAPEGEVSPWELGHLPPFRGTLPGSLALGEHGPEYRPDPVSPAEAVAILDCGHRILFPVPPVTGEALYCYRCETWETCVVPGGYLVKCDSCDIYESHFGHDSVLALARARTHAFGKGQRKRTTPHRVFIGQFTEGSVEWSPFERG